MINVFLNHSRYHCLLSSNILKFMKNSGIVFLLLTVLTVLSCRQKSKEDEKDPSLNASPKQSAKVKEASGAQLQPLDWADVPELTGIGNFPFFKAPDGIDVYDFSPNGERDGISELFPLKKWEVYHGGGITTVEGKLAFLLFMEDRNNGLKYDQYLFDRYAKKYIAQIGAKKLYEGPFPEEESTRSKLNENKYTGHYSTAGLSEESPLQVYAFKNSKKKYIVNIQSNGASGNIFIIELEDFE